MIVDIRCEGDEFRVSLRAMNRHEYEEALVRIDAVADMIWPSGRAAPDLSRDPVEPPQDAAGVVMFDNIRAAIAEAASRGQNPISLVVSGARADRLASCFYAEVPVKIAEIYNIAIRTSHMMPDRYGVLQGYLNPSSQFTYIYPQVCGVVDFGED